MRRIGACCTASMPSSTLGLIAAGDVLAPGLDSPPNGPEYSSGTPRR
jgi:hypothetical protein